MSVSILYAEHDTAQRDAVTRSLGAFDFKVSTVGNCADTRAALTRGRWDLIALNQDLPDGDGIDLTREIRNGSSVPIILLSAKDAEIDRVLALELGADDCVCLSASHRELVARVRAILRRVARTAATALQHVERRRPPCARLYRFAGWELNVPRRLLANAEGVRVSLTNTEFAVLVALLGRPQQVLTRDQLLESSRMHCDVFDRTIDVQILRLRRKVEADPSSPAMIRTERGVGYFLDVSVEAIA